MNFFDQLPTFSPDSILGLEKVFLEDNRDEKINFVIGVYEHPQKRYGGFLSVRKAQSVILEEETNKRYLPILGLPTYLEEMRDLVFGSVDPDQIVSCQALGGTGALHLGAKIFSMAQLSGKVYVPQQSWGNHIRIFSQENLDVVRYPYYSVENKNLLFEELESFLKEAQKHSLVLFHCCCHNPTGLDLTEAMWKKLAELMKEKQLIPFFDSAYLGFAEGIEKDRKPIQICISEGIPVFVAACASKNFGLYGERVGYFAVHSKSLESLAKISSCLQEKIRGEYSSPSRHGAEIVTTILSNPYLKQEWLSELNLIRESLSKLRDKFIQAMRVQSGHVFDFISAQKGFFGYPGFSQKQVLFLREQKAVYTTEGGRFNLNGLTDKNINHAVQSFAQTYELS
ncbi:aromatic amino acid transaminase [Chlamydia sp. 17-3921]|uniref:aromatic amino acid transaminase n=1 Tax=Chlamydia sp. 17-3921 TaxID=2675798 RepID=UPI00191B8969|nr:aromatic amino acid transaminase [Chlamydia sp. 17-3921]